MLTNSSNAYASEMYMQKSKSCHFEIPNCTGKMLPEVSTVRTKAEDWGPCRQDWGQHFPSMDLQFGK